MNIEKIRKIQLVAARLLELEPALKIKQAQSEILDFYVELPVDRTRFAVFIQPMGFFHSEDYERYRRDTMSEKGQRELMSLPNIAMWVDGDMNYWFSPILSWDFSEPVWNDDVQYIELSNQNFTELCSRIRRHNMNIELLNDDKRMVVKTIALTEDSYRNSCNAEIVYLRELSPQYRMTELSRDLSEKEQFKRKVEGYLQEEYPQDELDDSIWRAVRKAHPNASEPHSKLMLFTNEYRSLLRYRNYKRDTAQITILPDLSTIPQEVIPRLGRIEGFRFDLDIMILIRQPHHAYSNEGYTLHLPMNNWFATLLNYSQMLKTYHRLTEII